MNSLKLRIIIIVLGFTLITQVIYLKITVNTFQESFNQVLRSNLSVVGISLKNNLDEILSKGIAINKLFGLQGFMTNILNDAPDLSSIAIFDDSGTWLYYNDRTTFLEGEDLQNNLKRLALIGEESPTTLLFKLTGGNKAAKGTIVLSLNKQRISETVRNIALD